MRGLRSTQKQQAEQCRLRSGQGKMLRRQVLVALGARAGDVARAGRGASRPQDTGTEGIGAAGFRLPRRALRAPGGAAFFLDPTAGGIARPAASAWTANRA